MPVKPSAFNTVADSVARSLSQTVGSHLRQWLSRSIKPESPSSQALVVERDALLTFITQASSMDEVWVFLQSWLHSAHCGSLWLTVRSLSQPVIALRYSTPQLPEPVHYTLASHTHHHLIDSFLSGDTTFCGSVSQLGLPLSRLLPEPAPRYYFSVPFQAMGQTVAVLTLGFFHMDANSQQLVSRAYACKEMMAQVIAHCLLRETHTTPSDLDALSTQQHIAVQSLMAALSAKDPYTSGHSYAVGEYAEQLARYLQLPLEEIQSARLAAQLHDIGKLGIPDRVLKKPAALDEDEWAIMRQHPEIGANQILQAIPELHAACQPVLGHHERWDGSGYPYGLKGEAIPLGARIVSIVDAYHGLTSDRPYRGALSRQQTEDLLQKGAGSNWDPELIQVFIQLLKQKTYNG